MNCTVIKHLIYTIVFLMGNLLVFGQEKPNVVIIYADDLGLGDISVYGSTTIETPNIDDLARTGQIFTNAHATASTCTPSRYSLITGDYPFRQTGTGILPGDAKLIIPITTMTLPRVFKKAGYVTAIVGKWHLGLGEQIEKNWNEKIVAGPNNVGFDYSFIFPATADRVPTIFLENQELVGGDPEDPIRVSYTEKIGNEPTGKENPELLKMKASPNHGHNNTIVNGIGRIGWMEGGRKARWTDEEISFTFFEKLNEFLIDHKNEPFFMFYSATEPHVPRMPATMFKGKSGLGLRGDAILQLDYTVGQIVRALKSLDLYDNTIIIFSSDNGPVLDDGYQDEAVTKLGKHDPFWGYRGGKYSAFEAGARIPFIISYPKGNIQQKKNTALISQVDLLRSFASYLDVHIPDKDAIDSRNHIDVLLGRSEQGRDLLIKSSSTHSVISGQYKYIKPHKGPKIGRLVNIELGNDSEEQLYDLQKDPGERENIAKQNNHLVKKMKNVLEQELKRTSF